MAEQQQVARVETGGHLGLVDVVVQLVRHKQHDEVPARGGLGDRQDLETRLGGLGDLLRAGAQPHDDGRPGVLEVQRVRVPLRAEADDRDGLAVEEREVCVVVVEHGAGW